MRIVVAAVVMSTVLLSQHAAAELVVSHCKPSRKAPGSRAVVAIAGADLVPPGGAAPTVTFSGSGVRVEAVTRAKAERVRVRVVIDPDAPQGLRDVTVTRSDGQRRTARDALLVSVTDAPRLSGRVRRTAPRGSVVGGRITLFDPTLSYFRETRTSADGSWIMPGVPAGTYRLGTAARGADYVEQMLVVSRSRVSVKTQISPETQPGAWAIVGDTAPELFDATDIAILLADGRVFFCHDTVDAVIFDPVSGTKSFAPASSSEQGCTSATLLGDERVVFIGGQSPADPGSFTNAVPWVKAWNPAGSWSVLPSLQLSAGRWYPGLARLADGSLLAMGGGMAPDARRTETCERFDPATDTWRYTGSMLAPAEYPPSALLHNGKVLATWAYPQLYDPATEQWSATGSFVQSARGWPDHSDHSLVMLANGDALAVGVRRSASATPVMAERYDPATGAWRLTSNSALPRKRAEVVQLPDGRVLAAAGDVEGSSPEPNVLGVVKWSDLYDPDTDGWRRVADMREFREYHAITVLVPDGRVLTTGGTWIKFSVGPSSANVEAFSPPYLFRGVRPTIASISATSAPRGAALALDITPRTEVTSVVLVGTSAHTHWVDGGIPRRLVLPAASVDGGVSVTLPSDPNVLPLGHYLLFAMVDDIPSVAKIIRVTAS